MFASKPLQEKIDRMVVSDRSFIRGGWNGANGLGIIPFCAPEWSTISSWLWIVKQDIELNGHRIWSHGTKSSYICASLKISTQTEQSIFCLSKVLTGADEREIALKAAEDIMKLRTRKRIEIQNLDTKFHKSLLSERWKCELEGEKDALTERLAKFSGESTAKKAQNCSGSCSYK